MLTVLGTLNHTDNGHVGVDLDHPAGPRRGIIALQIHSGGPTEVRFRDLRLDLNPKH